MTAESSQNLHNADVVVVKNTSLAESYAKGWRELHVHLTTRDARNYCACFYPADVQEDVINKLAQDMDTSDLAQVFRDSTPDGHVP